MTHPDKILFPEINITKYDLANYYWDIADHLLPHLKNRPVSLKRYVDGIHKPGFYQKNAPDVLPNFCQSVSIKNKSKSGRTQYLLAQNKKSLVYFVQLDSITPHVWLSRKDKPNYPDRLVIDLDPQCADDFERVVEVAYIIKEELDEQDYYAQIMTTGSRGLHVMMPLQRKHPFEQVRAFASQLTEKLAKQAPHLCTTQVRKDKRADKVFLDIARNALGQTQVAPYSVRAKRHAPIATPLRWDELQNVSHAQTYTIKNIFKRLTNIAEPLDGFYQKAQQLKN